MTLHKDKRIASSTIEEQLYLVTPWDHKLHKTNPVGTLIWELVDKGYAQERIVQMITSRYTVSAETARADVAEFIQQALRKGLLRTDEK